MITTRLAADLQAAAEQKGCAICKLLERDEQRFFATLLYEQINDLRRRQQLQQSRGFCAAHARSFASVEGAPLGAAIIVRSLLGRLLEQERSLEAAEQPRTWLSDMFKGTTVRSIAALLRPQALCPACAHLNEQTRLYLSTLLAHLADRTFAETYTHSDGLCLPHLALALDQSPPAAVARLLLSHQRKVWGHLCDVLDEFTRKHDYRFKHETLTPEEQSIWRRALLLLSGRRTGRDERTE